MADESVPHRGEVWLVAVGPSIGGESQRTRPAVILGNDTANDVLNRVQVMPISSQVAGLCPAEAYVSVNGERRKAMADQITTSGKRCLRQLLGTLDKDDREAVGHIVRRQLDL
jgi:mRNA interferase MazF